MSKITIPILAPGTIVLCTYRLPLRTSWPTCSGPLIVGEVEEPGTDPEQWNGQNSEDQHCLLCGLTRVRYKRGANEFGILHDHTSDLVRLTAEQAAVARSSDVEKFMLLSSIGPEITPWGPDTRLRERPRRDIPWQTPPVNGDVQVIFEPDDLSVPLADLYHAFGQPLPFGYLANKWDDPRQCHPQNYYIAMWDKGVWCPMLQVQFGFDVTRFIKGFDRIEEEVGNTDPLCGLWRMEHMDRRPLFQRGYSTPDESQQLIGCTTREWSRGNRAGQDDAWFKDGRVNTGRKHPSCMERLEKVQWLL